MKRIPMILAAVFITSSCSMSDEPVAVQWGLRYYYEFIDDLIMAHHAAVLRRERVEQTPFKLRDSRGVDMDVTGPSRPVRRPYRRRSPPRRGHRTATRRSGRSGRHSPRVARRTHPSGRSLPNRGLKSIRARLYLDAGVGSVADLATRNPEELVDHLRRFVRETGFEGIAPLPGEARHAVAIARSLPALIEW